MTLPLILTTALLGLLGHWVDQWLEFDFPLFTLLGIFAGLVGAVYQLLKTLNKKK